MTQARNRKARQDANMDRQGMKGRITRQGRAADVISQPAGHPQPTDGGASQPHTMLCPPVPQRGPSRSLTSHQSMAWANPSASCPGLPSCDPGALPRAELGWPGMLAWLLVRHVHRGTSQLSLGGTWPGPTFPPSSFPPTSLRMGVTAALPPLGCGGDGAETQGPQGPRLFSLPGTCRDAILSPLAKP